MSSYRVSRQEVVKLLKSLISIPSVNSRIKDTEGRSYSEEKLARFVAGYLKNLGLKCRFEMIEKGSPNLWTWIDGTSKDNILLDAHTDTVSAENMSVPPFKGIVRGGKIFGRGACDDKGPLVAFLMMAKILATRNIKPRANLCISASYGEELGLLGIKAFMKHKFKFSGAILAEPSGLRMITTHKGLIGLEVIVFGKAAHSCEPQRGKNAIWAASRLVDAIIKDMSAIYQRRRHPLVGTPTIAPTIIRGGRQNNIIPDECLISINIRTLPGQTKTEIVNELKKVLKAKLPRGFSMKILPPFMSIDSLGTPLESEFVRRFQKVLLRHSVSSRPKGANFASNASITAGAGIPSIVFGPGAITSAHSADEHVEIDEVIKATQILIDFVTSD